MQSSLTASPVVALLALLLAAAVSVSAQFGHPLKGQWSGQWGPANASERLLLDLQWDGKAITGAINPGDENAVVKNVTFDYTDPSKWKVTLEAEGKDPSGKPLKIVATARSRTSAPTTRSSTAPGPRAPRRATSPSPGTEVGIRNRE